MVSIKRFSVMIVDDDQLIINDMKTIVDWNSYGFEIVATAYNGKKALSMFKQYRPDVIITDILMPIMNGLDLISAIREISPDTYILIVTSYSEFSYAKRAMETGVASYILKAEVSTNVFHQKLSDIHRELTSLSFIKQKSLTMELQNYFTSSEMCPSAETSPQLYEIAKNGYYFIFIGKLQTLEKKYHTGDTLFDMDYPGISELVKNTTVFSPADSILFQTKQLLALGIKYSRQNNSSFFICNVCNEFYQNVQSFSKNRYILFYFTKPLSIIKCKKECPKYQPYICFNTYFPKKTVNKLSAPPNYSSTMRSFVFPSSDIDLPNASKIYSDYIDALFNNYDIQGVAQFFEYLCLHYMLPHSEINWSTHNKSDLLEWVMKVHSNYLEKNKGISITSLTPLIQHTIQFMEHHFGEYTLNQETIAEHVEMSIGRLGVLFKQETGKTINDYLTDIRINAAIKLLKNSNYKIYEISEKVGYKSSQYFSQIFYQRTNRRPFEYRKKPR